MPDPRKCCILGVCCDPGGDAQRADLEQWLTAKLADFASAGENGPASDVSYAETAKSWVAELYVDSTAG